MTDEINNTPEKSENDNSNLNDKVAQEGKNSQDKAKPIRFQFGPDTTDEDIERFLDMILGPETDDKEPK